MVLGSTTTTAGVALPACVTPGTSLEGALPMPTDRQGLFRRGGLSIGQPGRYGMIGIPPGDPAICRNRARQLREPSGSPFVVRDHDAVSVLEGGNDQMQVLVEIRQSFRCQTATAKCCLMAGQLQRDRPDLTSAAHRSPPSPGKPGSMRVPLGTSFPGQQDPMADRENGLQHLANVACVSFRMSRRTQNVGIDHKQQGSPIVIHGCRRHPSTVAGLTSPHPGSPRANRQRNRPSQRRLDG